jgi:hypothetical protein
MARFGAAILRHAIRRGDKFLDLSVTGKLKTCRHLEVLLSLFLSAFQEGPGMTNDAKLGLVAGVGLVIALAVMFSKREHAPDKLRADEDPVSMVGTPPSSPRASTAPAAPVSPAVAPSPLRATTTTYRGQNHTVKYGESLYSLAQQYYGDGRKYVEIYRVNRRIVSNPDYVAPGTVLFIPDIGKEAMIKDKQ